MDTQPEHLVNNPAGAAAQEEFTNAGSLTPSASTQKLTLMGLPRELRDKIYDFVVEQNATSFATLSPMKVPVACVVSKQMRTEALARYLANARWEFDLRKYPTIYDQEGFILNWEFKVTEGDKHLLKKWLMFLAEDAHHLARFKIICDIKNYRWEVYISLVPDREPSGARNVDVDKRDENGQPIGLLMWEPPVGDLPARVWKDTFHSSAEIRENDDDPITYNDESVDKNLKQEINEYIEDEVVKQLAQKRIEGTLTGSDIKQALVNLTSHTFDGC